MQDGEEEDRGMPPNSTQNLNAKLSLTGTATQRQAGPRLSFTSPPPIQSYSPPVQIVGGPAHYRGGYHLSF
jgi:hypothetical protein